jgi:hypothetical protein
MSETLAEVLAQHADMTDRSSKDGCSCGGASNPSDYADHLATAVLAWVEARLAGAREDVKAAVLAKYDFEYDAQEQVTHAALDVVREALGVEVGS